VTDPRDALVRGAQSVPNENDLYPDGWPVRADDRLARAIYRALVSEEACAQEFGQLAEHERDDYRSAAVAARLFLMREFRDAVAPQRFYGRRDK